LYLIFVILSAVPSVPYFTCNLHRIQ